MTYYADMTPYEYFDEPNTVNIGWLDPPHPFPTGDVTLDFLDRLFALCQLPVKKTRGYHQCQLCTKPEYPIRVRRGQHDLCLGSAEIRVTTADGKRYAAPDLIYHYVTAHNYKPPGEFIRAVMQEIEEKSLSQPSP
jgi:hypothetical protein